MAISICFGPEKGTSYQLQRDAGCGLRMLDLPAPLSTRGRGFAGSIKSVNGYHRDIHPALKKGFFVNNSLILAKNGVL